MIPILLSKRDFNGEEFDKFCRREYENIRQSVKARKGKPDEVGRFEISQDKIFEKHYKRLYDDKTSVHDAGEKSNTIINEDFVLMLIKNHFSSENQDKTVKSVEIVDGEYIVNSIHK